MRTFVYIIPEIGRPVTTDNRESLQRRERLCAGRSIRRFQRTRAKQAYVKQGSSKRNLIGLGLERVEKLNSGPDSCSTSVASSSSSVPLLERMYAPCFDPRGLGRIDIARRGEPGHEVVSQASPASREWLARETRDEAIARLKACCTGPLN